MLSFVVTADVPVSDGISDASLSVTATRAGAIHSVTLAAPVTVMAGLPSSTHTFTVVLTPGPATTVTAVVANSNLWTPPHDASPVTAQVCSGILLAFVRAPPCSHLTRLLLQVKYLGGCDATTCAAGAVTQPTCAPSQSGGGQCAAFVPGGEALGACPQGTTLCSGVQRNSGSPQQGMCAGCAGFSAGDCKSDATGACVGSTAQGTCPAGTTRCDSCAGVQCGSGACRVAGAAGSQPPFPAGVQQGEVYCECVPGWMGSACDLVDWCYSPPCSNAHHECTSTPEGPVCACPPGTSGDTCTPDSDGDDSSSLCSPNPCANGGSCAVEIGADSATNSAVCTCEPGFTGNV